MRLKLNTKGNKFRVISILILYSIIINLQMDLSLVEDSNQVDLYQVIKTGENKLKTSTISGKISVSGNFGWAFLKTTGKCTGSGISSDPYIIKDLVIDGGGSGNCILIDDSDVYFKIQNCTIYNSGGIWGNAGIRFEAFVRNGQLINNTIYDCENGIFINWESTDLNVSRNNLFNNYDAGIYFINSHNNSISDNIISTNGHGMFILNSSSNIILDNQIRNNMWTGLHVTDGSNNNLIQGNFLNYDEIKIYSCSRNIIRGNTITNIGVGIFIDKDSTCNIYSNNIFNGNNDDIQDNQAECSIENPFPVETALTLGIIIIGITLGIIAIGLIIRRKYLNNEVRRFEKQAKREAEKKILVERRDKLSKLEDRESEQANAVLEENKVAVLPPPKEKLSLVETTEEAIFNENQTEIVAPAQLPKEESEIVKETVEPPKGEMISCPFCGKELSSDFIFCLRCGKKLDN